MAVCFQLFILWSLTAPLISFHTTLSCTHHAPTPNAFFLNLAQPKVMLPLGPLYRVRTRVSTLKPTPLQPPLILRVPRVQGLCIHHSHCQEHPGVWVFWVFLQGFFIISHLFKYFPRILFLFFFSSDRYFNASMPALIYWVHWCASLFIFCLYVHRKVFHETRNLYFLAHHCSINTSCWGG